MARRLFTLLSALSLLMCAVTAVLWVRSYYVHDLWVLSAHTEDIDLVWASAHGRAGRALSSVDPVTGRRLTAYLGGEISFFTWFSVFATLPFLWLVDWAISREAQRRNPHACPSCCYDLRATPGRCPECGAAPHDP